jgi:hypothetical protein
MKAALNKSQSLGFSSQRNSRRRMIRRGAIDHGNVPVTGRRASEHV